MQMWLAFVLPRTPVTPRNVLTPIRQLSPFSGCGTLFFQELLLFLGALLGAAVLPALPREGWAGLGGAGRGWSDSS